MIFLFFLIKTIDILISIDSINEGKAIESNLIFVLYPNLQFLFLVILPIFFLLANFFVMKNFPELILLITFGMGYLNLIGAVVLVNNFEIYTRVRWI